MCLMMEAKKKSMLIFNQSDAHVFGIIQLVSGRIALTVVIIIYYFLLL